MSEQSNIEVWIDDASESVETKGALPSLKESLERGATNVALVASELLTDNLRQFLANIESTVIDAQPNDSAFDIEQIELNLVVNANGGVELVGKLSAGAEASMKVVLKRRKPRS